MAYNISSLYEALSSCCRLLIWFQNSNPFNFLLFYKPNKITNSFKMMKLLFLDNKQECIYMHSLRNFLGLFPVRLSIDNYLM